MRLLLTPSFCTASSPALCLTLMVSSSPLFFLHRVSDEYATFSCVCTVGCWLAIGIHGMPEPELLIMLLTGTTTPELARSMAKIVASTNIVFIAYTYLYLSISALTCSYFFHTIFTPFSWCGANKYPVHWKEWRQKFFLIKNACRHSLQEGVYSVGWKIKHISFFVIILSFKSSYYGHLSKFCLGVKVDGIIFLLRNIFLMPGGKWFCFLSWLPEGRCLCWGSRRPPVFWALPESPPGSPAGLPRRQRKDWRFF